MSNRAKIISIVVVFFGFIFLQWAYTHSFIEVTVDSSTEGTLVLKDQKTDKSTSSDYKKPTFKKLVSKSEYEVLVTSKENGANHFAIVETGRFLKTTKITAQLQSEKSRQFVGDSPDPCMDWTNNLLISYTCGGFFGDAKIHQPADEETPTYISNPDAPGFAASIRNTLQIQGQLIGLMHYQGDDDNGPVYSIYTLDKNLSVVNMTVLPDLDVNNTSFTMRAYGTGFVIFDNPLTKAYYYSSVGAKPTQLTLEKPTSTGIAYRTSNFSNNSILSLYSTEDTSTSEDKITEIVVTTDGKTQRFNFDKKYLNAQLCGTKKLCLLGSGILDVYDISTDQPTYDYSLHGARTLDRTNSGILVARDNVLLSLDVDNRSGYAAYSFGDYALNSIKTFDNAFLLNLVNNKGASVAIYFDEKVTDRTGIDKKIAELQKLSEIDTISVSGSFISIVPSLGASSDEESYEATGAQRKSVTDTIERKISELKIDRSTFKISITF